MFRFLDFILPRTKKRFSAAFIKKVSKKESIHERFNVSYDAICSLLRLFEKEIELFRMISKLIKKIINGYFINQQTLLQISDVF